MNRSYSSLVTFVTFLCLWLLCSTHVAHAACVTCQTDFCPGLDILRHSTGDDAKDCKAVEEINLLSTFSLFLQGDSPGRCEYDTRLRICGFEMLANKKREATNCSNPDVQLTCVDMCEENKACLSTTGQNSYKCGLNDVAAWPEDPVAHFVANDSVCLSFNYTDTSAENASYVALAAANFGQRPPDCVANPTHINCTVIVDCFDDANAGLPECACTWPLIRPSDIADVDYAFGHCAVACPTYTYSVDEYDTFTVAGYVLVTLSVILGGFTTVSFMAIPRFKKYMLQAIFVGLSTVYSFILLIDLILSEEAYNDDAYVGSVVCANNAKMAKMSDDGWCTFNGFTNVWMVMALTFTWALTGLDGFAILKFGQTLWYIGFKEKKNKIFVGIIVCLPLLFILMVLASGNGFGGQYGPSKSCFFAWDNDKWVIWAFFFAPTIVSILAVNFCIVNMMITLYKSVERTKQKHEWNKHVRLLVFLIAMNFNYIVTVAFQIMADVNDTSWANSATDFLVCSTTNPVSSCGNNGVVAERFGAFATWIFIWLTYGVGIIVWMMWGTQIHMYHHWLFKCCKVKMGVYKKGHGMDAKSYFGDSKVSNTTRASSSNRTSNNHRVSNSNRVAPDDRSRGSHSTRASRFANFRAGRSPARTPSRTPGMSPARSHSHTPPANASGHVAKTDFPDGEVRDTPFVNQHNLPIMEEVGDETEAEITTTVNAPPAAVDELPPPAATNNAFMASHDDESEEIIIKKKTPTPQEGGL